MTEPHQADVLREQADKLIHASAVDYRQEAPPPPPVLSAGYLKAIGCALAMLLENEAVRQENTPPVRHEFRT
jgi:hypothetical protein